MRERRSITVPTQSVERLNQQSEKVSAVAPRRSSLAEKKPGRGSAHQAHGRADRNHGHDHHACGHSQHDHAHAGHHDHAHHHDDHAPNHEPEFEVTLTAENLRDLARFNAAWSQIEFLLANVAAFVEKGDLHAASLQMEGMSISARIDHLRGMAARMPNDRARQDVATICDLAAALVPGRNHVMHGVWGLFVDRTAMTSVPACFNGRDKKHPVFATALPAMTCEAADVSRRLGALLGHLTPSFGPGHRPRRFFFSDGPPPAGPLPEWSERDHAEGD